MKERRSVPIHHIFTSTALLALGLMLPSVATAHPISGGGCNPPANDHGHVSVSVATPVSETDSSVTFNVICNPCAESNTSTWWSTMDGTAMAGSDYVAVSGFFLQLGIDGSPESFPVVVDLINDSEFEPDQSFSLGLGGAPGGNANPTVGEPCMFFDFSGATVVIESEDPENTPPVADAGADDTNECASPGGTLVMLDGTGSSDSDGDPLTYTWTGPFSEGGGTTTGPTPTVTLPVGVHAIMLEVDDGIAGDTDTVTITVEDTTDPVVTLVGPSELTLECNVDTYTELGATASDTCDGPLAATPSGVVDVTMNGDYVVTYTATDSSGNSGSETRTVHVEDNTPPVITLEGLPELTLECGVDTYTELGATASDACDGDVAVVISGSVDTSTPGEYIVTYTAVDASGNEAMETRTINVVDTLPPVIEVEAGPLVLWPPNHKYKSVSLDDIVLSASDICDQDLGASDVVIASVSSDEDENANGAGDGNTVDDIVIGGFCRTVDLRSERQGGGNGRVYTIHMAVSDSSGNVGAASFEVQVPHNKKGAAVDDGPAYSEAESCGSLLTTGSSLFKGRITNALDREGLEGVEVLGPGEAMATSDENGRYSIELPGDSTLQLRLKKSGYFNRRTYVDALKEVNRADLTLIPQQEGFSMKFFQHVFREPLAAQTPMTRRWVEEPVFELYSRQFEEITGQSKLRAGARLSKRFRRLVEETLRTDVPLYTGGVLRGDRISWIEHKRGDEISEPRNRPGRIRLVVKRGGCDSGADATAVVKWSEAGLLEGGRIDLFADCGGMDRGVLSHELAHHLGYFHAKDRAKVPLPSIMGATETNGPTEADILHGGVLYQRFPGNQEPDRDLHPERLTKASDSATRSVSLSCRR